MRTLITRSFLQLLADVIVGVLLFLVACLIAGLLKDWLAPHVDWLYGLWFALGMVPFLLYAHYRDVLEFDRWDLLAYAPLVVALSLTAALVDRWVGVLLLALLSPLCHWFRQCLPGGKRRATQPRGG